LAFNPTTRREVKKVKPLNMMKHFRRVPPLMMNKRPKSAVRGDYLESEK